MTKFVILGGGTAGWLSALFIRKLLPEANVTLIQSKEIGIIGVGEATTPHIVDFLINQDIDPLDVVRVTKGSIKNGINFVNWNGDGTSYFHDFDKTIHDFSIPNFYTSSCQEIFKKFLINNEFPLEEYVYQQKLAYGNKIDLVNTNYALHFDSIKFADYLEETGRNRNIKILNDQLLEPILDDKGFIKTLRLESGLNVECDFVFDCTGFARLLIGKLYNTKWHSYSNFLPAKKAIPFWLDHKDDIKPYTDSIAMKNGWMWNIPLQHRVGAGYVFDSDYISADEAKLEVEECIGQEIEVRKVISFDPGRYEQVWVKNCLAIGLSSNFLEPLESTSLWLAISQLNQFKMFISEIHDPNPVSQRLYNKMTTDAIDIDANFIHFHYLTKRNDSKFWQEFKEKNKTPAEIVHVLDLINNAIIREIDIVVDSKGSISVFPLHSYFVVGKGLGMFNKKFNLNYLDNLSPTPNQYKKFIDNLYNQAPLHKTLLNHLQKGPLRP